VQITPLLWRGVGVRQNFFETYKDFENGEMKKTKKTKS